MGVPFYLLLVGSPEEIPFEFQYMLDIYWAVGRLHFDDPDDYRRYAESVVAYETAATVPHTKTTAIFATRHKLDRATQMFADHGRPAAGAGPGRRRRTPARPPVGQRQGSPSNRSSAKPRPRRLWRRSSAARRAAGRRRCC